jgi:VWFA-related protein
MKNRKVLLFILAAMSWGQQVPPAQTPPAQAPTTQAPPSQATPPMAQPLEVKAPPVVATIDKNAPEIAARDAPTNFSTRVNLVMVPVIVRDSKGRSIGNLVQNDFQLFDKGKLQVISRFTVENAAEKAANQAARMKDSAGPGEDLNAIPTRFVAYVFDDAHLGAGDLMQAREAARKHLHTALLATDRAGVFTTSGTVTLDFTGDQEALDEAMKKVQPKANTNMAQLECPPVTYYMADQIQKGDGQAFDAAVQDAIVCANLDPTTGLQAARGMAQGATARVVAVSEHEILVTLDSLNGILSRMSSTPGQRLMVLISPGFYITRESRIAAGSIVDKALRSNVVISTVDARGLYTVIAGGDASVPGRFLNASTQILKNRYQMESAQMEGDILGELSDGTGGTWFHNNNDIVQGLKQTSAAPEYQYILGFSPQNLKFDGSFHGLRVTVKAKDVTLQARRGYYTPKHAPDDAEAAKEEVREAFFSRDEMVEIPVGMQTQFFKTADDTAKVSVLAKVDLKQMRFRKADGRNLNTVTIVTGLFDRNGNMVQGWIKTIDLKFKDENMDARLNGGLQVKTSFDVPTGKYVVRLVVRDSEGQAMAAKNGVVDVP